MTEEQKPTACLLAEAAFNAAWACPHTIDSDVVALHFDSRKPGHNALTQLHRRIEAAVTDLAPAQLGTKPAAWQVWWGIGEMTAHWPPFQTRAEAEHYASQIKSVTEVRVLYAADAKPATASTDTALLDALAGTLVSNGWFAAKGKDSFTVYLGRGKHATRKTLREAIGAAREGAPAEMGDQA